MKFSRFFRRNKKLVSFCLVLVIFSYAHGETQIPSQISFSLGSISGGFTENPDNLTSTDGTKSKTTPYSGSASSMPLDMNFEYFPNLKRSYFVEASAPIVGATPDRYYSLSGGANFYFTQLGAETKVRDFNFEMKIVPKLRYYLGPGLGVGYFIYNTKSATKSDLLFEVGGKGGVIYTMNPKWGIKAELGATRAIGTLVSATVVKILFGTTYNLGM